MNNQPISVFYETKVPYYVVTVLLVVGFLIGFIITGGDYLMNVFFYFLCISIAFFLLVCFYSGSKFYIYEDKLVWKKGFREMESPWNEVIGIHYDYAPNVWYLGRNFKSNNFFLETKKGYTKYANEWNIRKQGAYTLRSKSKDLMDELKKRSGAQEDTGAVSMLKQRQNLWGIIILVGSICAVGLGGILYLNYFFNNL